MTQAFNLSQFANKLNTSGQTDNTGLQNSAVTVTAGTGMSGGGSVALGSSVTLTNAGVTSIVAGSGISISGATGAVTVSSTITGGVTSLNGQTGAIVNTDLNAIGSYVIGRPQNNTTYARNATVAGTSLYSTSAGPVYWSSANNFWINAGTGDTGSATAGATLINTGTWRCVSSAACSNGDGAMPGLWVRIS